MKINLAFVMSLASLAFNVDGFAQQPRIATIITKSPRPLLDLAQALTLKEGWLIDYEDPAYLYAGDLVDVTAAETSQAFRTTNPGKRNLGIRNRPVTFEFPFRSSAPELLNPAALVSTLITLNQRVGNPGTFKVISKGRHLDIYSRSGKKRIWRIGRPKGIAGPANKLS